MPTIIKMIKGIKYLYYFNYNDRRKVETCYGQADDPEAMRKILKLELKHLVEKAKIKWERKDIAEVLGKAIGTLRDA